MWSVPPPLPKARPRDWDSQPHTYMHAPMGNECMHAPAYPTGGHWTVSREEEAEAVVTLIKLLTEL